MKICQFKSRKEWSDAVWHKLLKDIKNPSLSVALDSLLGAYEKQIIVNRLAALSLIKDGKTYKQIGEELWLSPTTISSLKKTLANNFSKEYQSQRAIKNKRNKQNAVRIQRETVEWSPFWNRVDFYLENFPRKNGPRWKWVK